MRRVATALAAVCGAVALCAATAVPAGAALGQRPLAKGSKGKDVRDLQRLLRRAGFGTKVDGMFGSRTERMVLRLERELGLVVDGRITREDVLKVRTALRPSEGTGGFSTEALTRPKEVSQQVAPGSKAVLTPDGLAIPPADAPEQVKQVIAAANAIAHKPYRYGGGHARWEDKGYDCSGSVSYALHGGGLLETAMPSGGFTKWGEPGEGQWITLYAHGGHIYMVVAGLRFDTSGRSKTGSRWQADLRSPKGFAVRHPEGL